MPERYDSPFTQQCDRMSPAGGLQVRRVLPDKVLLPTVGLRNGVVLGGQFGQHVGIDKRVLRITLPAMQGVE